MLFAGLRSASCSSVSCVSPSQLMLTHLHAVSRAVSTASSHHPLYADIKDRELQNNVLQGAKWASITCIVVSAPVIGRVAQVSFERALGTICGGILGYLIYVLANSVSMVTNEVRCRGARTWGDWSSIAGIPWRVTCSDPPFTTSV